MSKLTQEYESLRQSQSEATPASVKNLALAESRLAEEAQEVASLKLMLTNGSTQHGTQDVARLAGEVAKLTMLSSARATQLSEAEAQLATSTEDAKKLKAEMAEMEAQLATSKDHAKTLMTELAEAQARAAETTHNSTTSFTALAEAQQEVAE